MYACYSGVSNIKKTTKSFHSIVLGQLNIHEVDEAVNVSYYLDNLKSVNFNEHEGHKGVAFFSS